MTKFLASIVAMIAASACVASAQTGDLAPSPGYETAAECTIDVTRTRHGVRFEALVRAEDSAAGEYEFVLTKDDRGGSSDIMQGGAFSLAAGETSMLGSSEISLERGADYRARLVLWNGDEEVCRVERRS
jgi:hypothetical protein